MAIFWVIAFNILFYISWRCKIYGDTWSEAEIRYLNTQGKLEKKNKQKMKNWGNKINSISIQLKLEKSWNKNKNMHKHRLYKKLAKTNCCKMTEKTRCNFLQICFMLFILKWSI